MLISFLLSRKRNFHIIPATLLTMVLVLAFSCDDVKKEQTAFVKGKIVNPKNGVVVLTNYQNVNDTIALNMENEFTLNLKKVSKPGLYTFWHAAEYQSIYIEPGDSVALFVDTKSFDESLAFSSGHAKENNYLIDMFVKMEEANKAFLPQYKKEPAAFLDLITARANKQIEQLHKDAKKQNFSKDFVPLVEQIIWLNNYNKKERYVAAHYGSSAKPCTAKVPETFYDHRETIDLENVDYLNNNSFKAYLNSLIANKTREKLLERKKDSSNLSYALTRLQVTNDLLLNDTMRELYLLNYTRNYLRNAKDQETPQAVLKSYLSLSKNENNEAFMQAFATSFKTTRTGNDLADLLLKNDTDSEVMLGAIVAKPSIIYYWSSKDETYNMQVHLTVADLRKKYPEFDFIGINTDEGNSINWRNTLSSMGLETKNEYQVASDNNYNLSNVLKGSKRAILIDEDLTILDSNLNLLHYKIETTLLGYVSK
jgi:hypothetical protein